MLSVIKHNVSVFLLVLTSVSLVGCMSIQEAASAGNVGEVKKQLAWGVNPNSRTFWYKRSPLHTSAAYGRTRVVKLLLENGANVNIRNEGGETPLHYATGHGHINVMKVLLENGANVSEKGTGCGTPLQWAAGSGRIKEAKLLLAYDADVNQKGTSGYTALHTAVASRPVQVEMIKFLLSRGADVNTQAIHNRTPLNTAYDRGDEEMVRILLEHGADPAIGRKIPQSFIEQLNK